MQTLTAELIESAVFRLQIPGFDLRIAWDTKSRMLAIEGVENFDAMKDLVGRLAGQPTKAEATVVHNGEAKPASAVRMTAKLSVVPPPEEKLTASVESTPATESPEDYSVFGRLQKLGDIVTEAMRRGADTFEAIKEFINKLRDAEACPALDRIDKQGDFDGRLRQHCASRQIPGAL